MAHRTFINSLAIAIAFGSVTFACGGSSNDEPVDTTVASTGGAQPIHLNTATGGSKANPIAVILTTGGAAPVATGGAAAISTGGKPAATGGASAQSTTGGAAASTGGAATVATGGSSSADLGQLSQELKAAKDCASVIKIVEDMFSNGFAWTDLLNLVGDVPDIIDCLDSIL